MSERIFEFFFKYRPYLFDRGEVAFAWPWIWMLVAITLAAVLVPTVLRYSAVKGKSGRGDRAVLASLRTAAIALVIFALFRPMLILATSVPQQNFLGIVLDDSRSMQIEDSDGPRSELMKQAFSTDAELVEALSERFILRFFRFASDASRVRDASQLAFAGDQTDLGAALTRARQELSTVPLAGLVIVSDGADNTGGTLSDAVVPLQASGTSVFAVGVGRTEFERDISVRRVDTPRNVLEGTAIVIDLQVVQRGYGGRSVELFVEDSDRIVEQQTVELPADGEAARVRVHLTAEEPGPRVFRFRIPTQDGELVAQNNVQEALVVVEDRREKILYFEGEPRFEVGFARRAVSEDENLQLVVLQRTAEDKFLRLDIDGEDELIAGFPRTREELYRYRALVLGSVEASAFTRDQLRMISEFVSERGGGLLLLGGRRSFVEGGYAGTSLEDALPVVLDPATAGIADPPWPLDVSLTPAGLTHAVTQIEDTEEATAERWESLPPLSTVNSVTRLKPGAVALVTAPGVGSSDEQVVLAHHRYGRGKVVALTAQDLWLWQMHSEIELEDETHETLWRQMLRWLVSNVPDQVNVTTERDMVSPGRNVTIKAEVEDARFLRLNNTTVSARVTDPLGEVAEFPLDWTVERDGEYEASFLPEHLGIYEIVVDAELGGSMLGTDTTYVNVTPLDEEFYDAEKREPSLRRLAEETGGRYYDIDDVASLPEDITFSQSGSTVIEERDLWDMPIVFFLIVGLLSAEWGYRRARGLR